MGWMSEMFGGNREAARDVETRVREKGANYIKYDPGLVPRLVDDHEEIVGLFLEISSSLSAREYRVIPQQLMNFKMRLESHLLTENVRFYNYVEQQLADDPDNTALIRDFRKEMNTIARTVVNFIRKWHSTPILHHNAVQFEKEYHQIGEALQQRIQREERDLYPLYTD